MEWILGSLGLLVGERVLDYIVRKNATTKELIRKAARAAFDMTLAVHKEDRDRAEKMFLNLVETGLVAAHMKPNQTNMSIAKRVFAELWEARKRDYWDTAMAELNTAGKRGMKIGQAMSSGVSPLHPKVRMP